MELTALDLTPDEQKELMKKALDEWLDKQFAKFGKWASISILSLAFLFLVWMFFTTKGFKIGL